LRHRQKPTTEEGIDLFQLDSAQSPGRFLLSLKPSIILIRWPVVIICSYLLLNPSAPYLPQSFFHAFILLYVLSNVALHFFDEQSFASWSFYYPLVIADTIVLTLSLMINGRAETDFYLTFFLLIVVSCIFEDAKLRAVVSLLAPVIYGGLLLNAGAAFDSSVSLSFLSSLSFTVTLPNLSGQSGR